MAKTLSLILCATTGLSCADGSVADLVFTNGAIYTMDSTHPRAEIVAFRDGRITYVGNENALSSLIGSKTKVVDLQGKMLLPGFHDTHVHPVTGGIELAECDLNGAQSRREVLALVGQCRARNTADGWLLGGGFQLPLFPNGAPSRTTLDSLVPDQPTYFTSADGHTAWVNSRALEIAGVDNTTADPPPDGVIVRDDDGFPQGTLRESAMDLVARHIPPRSHEIITNGLARGLEMAAQFGITTLHDASAGEPALRAYASLEQQNKLTARVIVALTVDPAEGTEQIERLAHLRDSYMGVKASPIAAKIFADGVIEGGTAALLTPYIDQPQFRGELNFHPDTLNALVAGLDDAGFKVHVHAIGDRAIRVTLDAFEYQYNRDGGSGPRHIMSHIQLFDPADIPRFVQLGVIASFQPLWAYADTYITELTEPRLGPERSRWLYPINSVVETGAIVAGGSDWSVTSMNPLLAIEVALTRTAPDENDGDAWLPEERVDLATMLTAYTIHGAMAGDLEEMTGSITVGKSADFVVLERDLFSIPMDEIGEVQVAMTIFEGRVVYER